ncbi:MAG: 50S ribosomal protein L29 [Nitrospiraceae bacterium]
MEMKELRNLTEAELAEKARQLTQELFNLRFQHATGRIENPMRIRQTRRDVARVKTLLRQLALNRERPADKRTG